MTRQPRGRHRRTIKPTLNRDPHRPPAHQELGWIPGMHDYPTELAEAAGYEDDQDDQDERD